MLFQYTLDNIALSRVSLYKYLGVYFTTDLKWHHHVDHIIANAGKALGFIWRNAKNFSMATKELLFKPFVRSVLEYACEVWDPPMLGDKERIERIQNLAARFVTGNYSFAFSTTQAKNNLQWESLDNRRKKLRLKLFHSIFHSTIGIDGQRYILESYYASARGDHTHKVREIFCHTELFRMSFFPRTIREWNRLPSSISVHIQ